MEIPEALRLSAERAGWSATRIAFETGRSEKTAYRWLSGDGQMRAADYQTLREKLPGFAALVDGRAVA